jgi:hypothetical protein
LFNEIADAVEQQAAQQQQDKFEKQFEEWQKKLQNSLEVNAPDRWPDFYALDVNIGGAVGWSGQVAIDRYGNVFVAPGGGNIGKSEFLFSGSISAGWIEPKQIPSSVKLNKFMSGNSYSAGAGFVAGFQETMSNNIFAREVGLITPQIGASYHYSTKLFNIFSVVIGIDYMKEIFLGILTGLIFLIVGIVCLLWPYQIQKYALSKPIITLGKFNPFLPAMKGKSYIWSLRAVGVLSLIAFVFLVVIVFKMIVGVL